MSFRPSFVTWGMVWRRLSSRVDCGRARLAQSSRRSPNGRPRDRCVKQVIRGNVTRLITFRRTGRHTESLEIAATMLDPRAREHFWCHFAPAANICPKFGPNPTDVANAGLNVGPTRPNSAAGARTFSPEMIARLVSEQCWNFDVSVGRPDRHAKGDLPSTVRAADGEAHRDCEKGTLVDSSIHV